ncbi:MULTISPECIES: AraC family transcriptional regulator [unclassified Leptolyngbya]|uniref:helix-turn-helix domain-containing protein n=1 Tax=unclassified Leptolyngbya TaxID=2650499 RepID=UPI0016826C20|nr:MULTISPECIES: AraC family transcriptional regulator [unclassified Leptolyngbya]MBD1909098.1 helix-turn-helix transcriptional regulator [Leptolyngbya sp. FACHB-8]MBD2158555.1 helix-turn-helix transcriptional regulator [Leptolyngbya sp. FACHB-16]
MNGVVEKIFPATERKIPLDRAPLSQLPQWGHWIETPDVIAAMLSPGQLEVNLLAPFEFISTRFQPGHGLAAFNSDKLTSYQSKPGGYDVVPRGTTYRSIETTGFCIILAFKPSLTSRIMAEYAHETTIELLPGQVQSSTKGSRLAQALHHFFVDSQHVGGALYLESLATLVMGHVIWYRSSVSKRLKAPDCLTPKQLRMMMEYVHSHLQSDVSLGHMASSVGVSSYYLAHAFKATTGLSPHQYVLRCRIEQAQRLLRTTQMPIVAIAYEVGFGNQSHMTTVFRKMLNTTPGIYRQQVTQ